MTVAHAVEAPAPRNAPVWLALDGLCDAVIAIALLGELLTVLANAIARTTLHFSLLWVSEVGGLALAVMAFVGGAVAYQRGQHMSVQAILAVLPPSVRAVCQALVEYAVFALATVVAYVSLPYLAVRWQQTSPMLQMPAAFLTLPLTIGMVLLMLFAIRRLLALDRRMTLGTGGALAILLFGIVATQHWWAPFMTGGRPLTLGLVALFATVLLGLPIGFALILCATLYVYTAGSIPMVVLPQSLGDGVSSNVLLAIPFFILAGLVMERGGISSRLVLLVRTLVGHLRGGLLHVGLVSMYLVSGLSGSKSADVAAVGIVLRDMLERDGYDVKEGAAVLAASAAMGETIPPSIAMLILGSITSLSMGALFIGGLLPAAVVGLCLMLLIYVRSLRVDRPSTPRATFAQTRSAAIHAALPLLMPVLLFAGILSGVATPSEVSAFAVAYGVVLAALVYRALGARPFVRMIVHAGTVAGMILFIVAAASSISWTLSSANVSQHVVDLLALSQNNVPLFMITSIVILIALGSLLEGFPALIILAPLMLPLAGKLGISQLHYGLMLLIAMGTGSFAPPLGVGFYVACAVMKAELGPTARVMLSYSLMLFVSLLIIAFVPWITLALPAAFGFVR
jgi:tripartite ATP-independent transporter DctM subunit